MNGVLKCKFCDYRVCLWSKGKNRLRKKAGYQKLSTHVYIHHADEYDKIQQKLKEEEELDADASE